MIQNNQEIVNKVKISLIITVYNGEQFLTKCLDSVVNQNFRQFRLILVDDGSTDNSGKIADNFEREYPEIISVIHQSNGGLSNARNTGIKYVDTKYIAFADADDELKPDYLEKLYLAAEKSNSDYVICGYTRIDENGNEIGVRKATDWEMKLDDGRNHVFTYTAWGRLYLTELITKNEMKFSEGEGLEDIPFNIYMNIAADKCVAIDYEGYLYRVNQSSITEKIKKDGAKAASSVMKFPFYGLENTIVKLRKKFGNKFDDILYYEIIKNFVGLLFFIAESSSKKDIHKVSSYECGIIAKYFSDVKDVTYLKIRRFSKLPLAYRMAVSMYMIAYKTGTVYQFALLYRSLKNIGKMKRI